MTFLQALLTSGWRSCTRLICGSLMRSVFRHSDRCARCSRKRVSWREKLMDRMECLFLLNNWSMRILGLLSLNCFQLLRNFLSLCVSYRQPIIPVHLRSPFISSATTIYLRNTFKKCMCYSRPILLIHQIASHRKGYGRKCIWFDPPIIGVPSSPSKGISCPANAHKASIRGAVHTCGDPSCSSWKGGLRGFGFNRVPSTTAHHSNPKFCGVQYFRFRATVICPRIPWNRSCDYQS